MRCLSALYPQQKSVVKSVFVRTAVARLDKCFEITRTDKNKRGEQGGEKLFSTRIIVKNVLQYYTNVLYSLSGVTLSLRGHPDKLRVRAEKYTQSPLLYMYILYLMFIIICLNGF